MYRHNYALFKNTMYTILYLKQNKIKMHNLLLYFELQRSTRYGYLVFVSLTSKSIETQDYVRIRKKKFYANIVNIFPCTHNYGHK